MIRRIQDHLPDPETLAAKAESAEATAQEWWGQAQAGLQSLANTTREQIERYPLRSLMVALALGVTLGCIIKRR